MTCNPMTPEQQEAGKANDIAFVRCGDIAKADTGASVVPWLIESGLIVEQNGKYAFTAKAGALLLVAGV